MSGSIGEQVRESAAVARTAVQPPRSRAYEKARRHSGRVRLFKIVIPVGAAIAIGLVLTVTFLDPFGRLAGGLQVGPISLSGTKIAMENPRLTGYRQDNRGYEVSADHAYQDVRKPTVIELDKMKARVAMDDSGRMAHLTSDAGVFDSQKEQLELRQNVRVITDDGNEALLRSASVDFKAGTVRTDEPVVITLTNARVQADTMLIVDGGRTITFTGRVKTQMDGTSGASAGGPAPKLAQGGSANPSGDAAAGSELRP